MAVSLRRSSARVAPRSVRTEAATSTAISWLVAAVDSTAPVQDMSPTVRYRTVRVRTCSPSRGRVAGPTGSHMPSREKTSRSWA